jgi:5'-nucleotidase
MNMRKLYIDLDGVMADFDRYFVESFGVASNTLDDPTLWKWINGHGNFFRNLPLCEGAVDFFNSVRHLNPTILTACPKTNYTVAAVQKRAWVYENLSADITVIPMMGGKNKVLFMHSPGDVLIDDFEKNCIPWREHGGIAIQHKNFVTTTKQLDLINDAVAIYNI